MTEQEKEKVLHGLDSCGFCDGVPNICEVTECPYRGNKGWCVHELAHDAGMLISELMEEQEPPTGVSISSAIECLLHPQDADDSDMVKAVDTAVRAMSLLKGQEPGKVNITITQSDGWKEGNCPFCGMKVDSFYNWSFCGTCGKGLKWE